MSLIMNYVKRVLHPVPLNARNCKMVIAVRMDITMGRGKTAAQCAHAAVECCRQMFENKKHNDVLRSWLMDGQPKVVVRIRNEYDLIKLSHAARKAGLVTAIIRDAGRTQLQPGTISVLGIGPAPKLRIDEFTSDLKLL